MFLPIGDLPNPPKAQWVTRILLGLNVAIHLLVAVPLSSRPADLGAIRDPELIEIVEKVFERSGGVVPLSEYDIFTMEYGYKPGKPDLLSLFFCMFLHANWMHVLGNMLYLWIFGDNVEWRLGPVRFVIAYLVTGVAATLSFSALAGDSLVPLVGASGAISGVLGFYLLWFPHNQIRVLLFFFFIQIFYVRAVWVLGFYLIVDNLLPFLAQRGIGGGGVAHGAHIGGFVAGVCGAYVLNRILGPPPIARPQVRRARARWGSPELRRIMQSPVDDPSETFAAAVGEKRMSDAAHAFARIAREGGAPPRDDHVFELGEWLYKSNYIPDSAAVFRYYIKNFPRGDDLDRVHLGLGILLARRLGQPSAAREHLLSAIEMGDEPIAKVAREELDRIGG